MRATFYSGAAAPRWVRWTRYRRSVDDGQWDLDSGVTHEAEGGRTLCGATVGTPVEKGGPWELVRDDRTPVTCARCLRVLARRQP